MKIKDEITLKIEKMINEGAGMGRFENLPVFVENSCTDDVLKVRIISLNKKYAKAEIVEIIEPSAKRVKPFCHLFNACGGCEWQHINYETQLEEKQNIVKETIKKISGLNIEIKPVIPSPEIQQYRHKIQMPVEQTKNSKRFVVGYYKKHSHELTNIKYCPIQPDMVNEIVEFIREKAQALNITAYNEKTHKGELRHIIFRHSDVKNNALLIFVVNNEVPSDKIKDLASLIYEKYESITGILFNINTSKTNSILGKQTIKFIGDSYFEEKLNDVTYKISAESFFQVNPKSAENIMKEVKKIIVENTNQPVILDAYAGVSSFGLQFKDIAKKVYCVEEVKSASSDAIENVKINNAENFEIINGDTEIIFADFLKQNLIFDAVVIDPPRKGCSEKTLEWLVKLSKNIIVYVSCNPATLARDLKYLAENGFKTNYIQPVDMFCHTHHIENIAFLEKLV